MKKGLSVLLIVAALFGFYGGATSLNDILASKDYWEEVGEQSTADMNKLEDGLNQLKDNEQAYLDGKEQLAEAEPQLEAGRAKLAESEAAYKAAPGKLAAGKAELDEGKEKLDGVRQLIAGCNKIISGYPTWKAGLTQLNGKDARQKLTAAIKAGYPSLSALSPFAGSYASSFTEGLEGINNSDGSESIDVFAANAQKIFDALPTIYSTAETYQGQIGALYNALSPLDTQTFWGAIYQNAPPNYPKTKLETLDSKLLGNKISVFLNNADKLYAGLDVAGYTPEQARGIVLGALKSGSAENPGAYESMSAAMAATSKTSDLYTGLDAFLTNYDTLAENQAAMADGVQQIAYNVVNNSTLRNAVKNNKKLGTKALTALKLYGSSKSPLFKENGGTSERFAYQMDTVPNIIGVLSTARSLLNDALKDGLKTYRAGLAEYNQGLADYAAAPGLLAEGRATLADYEKQLEEGKAKLAQYEDGEQQVRDGLATLMATEPDPGLTSIFDRLKDDDFDNGDAHLEIEEGLNAVEVGRGYQADSGELITKEITNRAVGTAAGLAAGALAVLAAILSFLKKNKGAGVSALIAAAAGLLGCFVGMGAGEYYSDIAGSTVGNLPFIAAGVLGAVAIVFAVVHFQAKPEAKAEAK